MKRKNSRSLSEQSDDEFLDDINATLTIVYSNKNVYSPTYYKATSSIDDINLPFMQRLYPDRLERASFEIHQELFDKLSPNLQEQVQKLVKRSTVEYSFYSTAAESIKTMPDMKKLLAQKFGKDSSFAEFIRFAKFIDVPQSDMDKLVKIAFQKAKTEGTDVVLISVDKLTKRLFERKYGFKTLTKISNRKRALEKQLDSKGEESILYLETNSKQFNSLLK
jgi:hypothetical protein